MYVLLLLGLELRLCLVRKSATVPEFKKIHELNRALACVLLLEKVQEATEQSSKFHPRPSLLQQSCAYRNTVEVYHRDVGLLA